jgi:hypothetical protein
MKWYSVSCIKLSLDDLISIVSPNERTLDVWDVSFYLYKNRHMESLIMVLEEDIQVNFRNEWIVLDKGFKSLFPKLQVLSELSLRQEKRLQGTKSSTFYIGIVDNQYWIGISEELFLPEGIFQPLFSSLNYAQGLQSLALKYLQ